MTCACDITTTFIAFLYAILLFAARACVASAQALAICATPQAGASWLVRILARLARAALGRWTMRLRADTARQGMRSREPLVETIMPAHTP